MGGWSGAAKHGVPRLLPSCTKATAVAHLPPVPVAHGVRQDELGDHNRNHLRQGSVASRVAYQKTAWGFTPGGAQ